MPLAHTKLRYISWTSKQNWVYSLCVRQRLGPRLLTVLKLKLKSVLKSEISCSPEFSCSTEVIKRLEYVLSWVRNDAGFSNAQAAKWNSLFEKDNKDTSAYKQWWTKNFGCKRLFCGKKRRRKINPSPISHAVWKVEHTVNDLTDRTRRVTR